MCLYPKLIQNRKYTNTKKNGGVIPPISDIRIKYLPIGCGNCIECRQQLSRNWQVRLSEEIKGNEKCYFVTLTFSETALEYWQNKILKYWKIDENEIATIAIRNFLENWRKKHKKSVKHWLITELGHVNTERIHIHGLIWTNHPEDINKIWNIERITEDGEIWTNGKTDLGQYVNQRTVNYIVKYVTKQDKIHPGYKPKISTSP